MHSPPLIILLVNGVCHLRDIAVIPFILSDLLAGVLVYSIARFVASASTRRLPISPATVAALFLWNPCSVLTAAAQSSATFTVTSILLALHGAVVQKSAIVAALGCALALYLDVYSTLFFLPVAMLLACGVENVLAAPCDNSVQRSYNIPVDVTVKHTPLCNCSVCQTARGWRAAEGDPREQQSGQLQVSATPSASATGEMQGACILLVRASSDSMCAIF